MVQQRAIGRRGEGRLRARPGEVAGEGEAGLFRLDLGDGRDGLYFIPRSYRAEEPSPLVVVLHGAGGSAHNSMALLQPAAEESGLILLAPDSRSGTWDLLRGGYGPDVDFIDLALGSLFRGYAVDRDHLALEGFSDGGSYALSLGLANGDLFTHILAFSPGFMAPPGQVGRPRIFVSHGTHDRVLPIGSCSRRIVPELERAGYDVEYVEFDGGHTVPPRIAEAAVRWFCGR